MLAGYDQKSNVVLSDSKERVYSLDEGVEEVPLGLYLVKGDMMCVARCCAFFSALSPLATSINVRRPPLLYDLVLSRPKVSPLANYALIPPF